MANRCSKQKLPRIPKFLRLCSKICFFFISLYLIVYISFPEKFNYIRYLIRIFWTLRTYIFCALPIRYVNVYIIMLSTTQLILLIISRALWDFLMGLQRIISKQFFNTPPLLLRYLHTYRNILHYVSTYGQIIQFQIICAEKYIKDAYLKQVAGF